MPALQATANRHPFSISAQEKYKACSGLRLPAPYRRSTCKRSRPFRTAVFAEGNIKERLEGAVRMGDRLADSAADLMPSVVPRGAAKLGVLGIGSLLTVWLLQKVVSTVLFLALMGGAAFLWLKLSGKDDDGNDDDALAEAKRIMNKYR